MTPHGGRRQPILLDCDPGHDDAVAMLLAARYGILAGVTTVAGNASIDRVTTNALVVADVIGYDGPVVAGAPGPQCGDRPDGSRVHGPSGLDGPAPRRPRRAPSGTDAAAFLVRAAQPGSWIVATGPLTNVASAILLDPGLARRVGGISVMAGSTRSGNVTPCAEFNVAADPEAARIVFSSGANVRMCGLNVTHQVLADHAFLSSIGVAGGNTADFFVDVLRYFVEAYSRTWAEGDGGAPLHDACAVAAVTHPELFRFDRYHVDVELTGTLTRGMTVVDQRPSRDRQAANADVATAVDAARLLDLVRDAIGGAGIGPAGARRA